MAAAACSALTGRAMDGATALTGEVSVTGEIRAVGGVPAKIEAARRAGLTRVLVPRANWMERFAGAGIEVMAVETLEEALAAMWASGEPETPRAGMAAAGTLAALRAEK